LNDYVQARRAACREQRAQYAALYGVDTSSRTARLGQSLMTISAALRLVEPVLVLGLVFLVAAHPALAQGPGNIFGSDATTPGRGLVEAIKYLRNVIFVAGVGFFMWAAINMGFEKPWGGKALSGAACWAFSGLAALVYEFSQGNSVQMDTSGLGR
jgi:hypothetical protein